MKTEEFFKKAKTAYDSIEIPADLSRRMDTAIDKALPHRRHWYRQAACAMAACFAVFVGALNTSQVFAQSVAQLPVLGSVAQVFTFREYADQDASHEISAEIPAVSGTGNEELETRINAEIQKRVDDILAEANQRSEAEHKAFLETGGKEEDYVPMKIDVTYDVKSSNEKYLSFVIYDTEVRATAFEQQIFYNIDLETGEDVTLEDLLGEDWKSIADESIREQIAERSKVEGNSYFDGSNGIPGFETVGDNPKFYINEAGNPVVCFDEYEIAPGYMGLQEFEIQK